MTGELSAVLSAAEDAGFFERLGLSWQSMVWHAAALIILIVAFRFLLFKPVKRMMDKRREAIDAVFGENERLGKEATAAKEQYENALADAKLEIARVSTEAAAAAEVKSAEIVSGARRRADEILAAAEAEADSERTRLAHEFKREVTALSVEIAGAVLGREVTAEDNARVIKDALREWEKK
ncbi:MAG: hypothetical protein FWE62_04615 [Firmicutes bacterium]|nr:hypothetical protein [Bacillota bacterium]